jgi:hypothetical protein
LKDLKEKTLNNSEKSAIILIFEKELILSVVLLPDSLSRSLVFIVQ